MPPIKTMPTVAPETIPADKKAAGNPDPYGIDDPGNAADQPSGLTMFFFNIVMIVILGCLTIGVEFALYAALLLAPIWLVAITLLVVFAADPDASLSE